MRNANAALMQEVNCETMKNIENYSHLSKLFFKGNEYKINDRIMFQVQFSRRKHVNCFTLNVSRKQRERRKLYL